MKEYSHSLRIRVYTDNIFISQEIYSMIIINPEQQYWSRISVFHNRVHASVSVTISDYKYRVFDKL